MSLVISGVRYFGPWLSLRPKTPVFARDRVWDMDTAVRRSDRLSCLRLGISSIVALLAVSFSGCGGCSSEQSGSYGGKSQEEFVKALKEKKQREADADREATQPGKRQPAKKATPPTQPAPPSEDEQSGQNTKPNPSRHPNNTASGEESSDGAPPPLPPPLPPPADLTQWDEHDFHVARLISDRRLVEAVAVRAMRPQKTEAEARTLIDLIALKPIGPSATAPTAAGPRRSGSKPEDAALLARAADALAANGTAMARQALVAMIQGTIPTADAKAAAEAALDAIGRQKASWADAILLDVVFQPERFLSEGGPWAAPDALRQRTLALLRGQQGSSVREQLALRLAQHAADQSGRSSIVGLLSEPVLANLPAQVVLYQSARLPQDQSVTLERHFATWSRCALKHWLELPPEGDEPVLEPSQAAAVARLLWNDQFVSILELRHRSIGALPEAPTLLALSATIPTVAMRKRLVRTLDRHYLDGPGVLRHATLASGGVFDPALPLSVREVIRENTRSATKSASRPPGGRPTPPPVMTRPPMSDDWEALVVDLLRQQCRSYFKAGLARMTEQRGQSVRTAERSSAAPGGEQSAKKSWWPFTLHAGAEALVHYEIDRESIGQSGRGPEAPLRLCYLRLEEKGRPSRPLSNYRRQIRNLVERRCEGGYWLAGRLDAEAGKACCIDLFVLPAKAGVVLAPEEEQQLTIELLVIQTTDVSDVLSTASQEP